MVGLLFILIAVTLIVVGITYSSLTALAFGSFIIGVIVGVFYTDVFIL